MTMDEQNVPVTVEALRMAIRAVCVAGIVGAPVLASRGRFGWAGLGRGACWTCACRLA